MKFKTFIIGVAMLLCGLSVSAKVTEADFAPLDSLMAGYFITLQGEDPVRIVSECDFLISSCQDSLTRQHVALAVFNRYKEAPVMGEEEVAIRIFDNWFKNGKVSFRNEFDRMDAEIFVRFNRSSLLGMEAPLIKLSKPCGGKAVIPEKGKTSVLFFYDTACSKCRLEAKVLPSVLKNCKLKMDFCAVYYGSDKKEWSKFRKEFRIDNPSIRLRHFWDPEIKSNYQMLYGVISTPKMYLVEKNGLIAGRRLEVESLEKLIPVIEEYYKSSSGICTQ